MTVSLEDIEPAEPAAEEKDINNAESMIMNLLSSKQNTDQMKSLARNLLEQIKSEIAAASTLSLTNEEENRKSPERLNPIEDK